jgi:hypothetical protein
VSPDAADLVPVVEAALARGVGILPCERVSAWLIGHVLPAHGAIPLKRSGGVYYVPPHAEQQVRRILAAVTSVTSFRFGLSPMIKCGDVVANVAHAIVSEIRAQVDGVRKACEKDGGAIGKVGLANQIEALRAAQANAVRLADTLGVVIEAPLAELNRQRAILAEVIAQAEARGEARDVALGQRVLDRAALVVQAALETDKRTATDWTVAAAQVAGEASEGRFQALATGMGAELATPAAPAPAAVQAAPAPAPRAAGPLVAEGTLCGRACAKYGAPTGILRYVGHVLGLAFEQAARDRAAAEQDAGDRRAALVVEAATEN